MSTVKIGPVTRVEGHLDLEIAVESVNGVQQVVDAKSSGTMFRGFEQMLTGHEPHDAIVYTQRICGVCPISHGMASSMALENAWKATVPANGRIIRNLVLGANFIQSHILHFYHLAALDYVDTTGVLDISPWTPRHTAADMLRGGDAQYIVGHYLTALAMRRKAHQMGAVLGGRLPCSPVFVPGGATQAVTSAKVTEFRTLLTELRGFISNVLVADANLLSTRFPAYLNIGKGHGNLLAYGVFDLDAAGTTRLLKRGRYTKGAYGTVSGSGITEYVKYSKYSSPTKLNPAAGSTTPSPDKAGAYSWLKAPRYLNVPHEVGPLARMWVNGDYRRGISAMDRLVARAREAKKVADAMDLWLNQLVPGAASYRRPATPPAAAGVGPTEAPRGALAHWVQIAAGKISRYQIVTPTGWNASPRDDMGQRGAIEQALIGTPVRDINSPIEVLRVVHSFDPCLSCSVHMVSPKGDGRQFVVGA